ncbi:hypothetical protein Dda_6394 [Drechslerella dactyloides]|uniref:Uncharacterized protein n=1 Tax=Drechslerella dactyloides TaxID=74499 RepID=A0AAD6NHD5_DREDA|nr:hypothetical protein Dda_6394 [Drechslerella dactyloides]
MKSTVILLCSALMSVGALAAPYGWESESSIAAVPTTDCESATWEYDQSSVPTEPTVPYEPTKPVWHPEPSSSGEASTPGWYNGTPSSEPVGTPVPTGYGSVPYYPAEEPTETLTSTIDSTITLEVTVSTYGPAPSSVPGYYTTLTTTSCPLSSSDAGYVPYTPTLTPVPYEYTTPASVYEPETPSPEPYPTGPAYYPPGNMTTPTPAGPSGNNTYPTAPPYYLPPYAGSATSMKVNKGGFIGTGLGLFLMVVFMGIL